MNATTTLVHGGRLLDLGGDVDQPFSETGSGVHTVIVAGEIVIQNRDLLTLSTRQLRARAEESRLRLSGEVEQAAARNAALFRPLLEAYNKSDRYPLGIDRFRIP
jgi:hypothetical protein